MIHELTFHADVITAFNNELYNNIFTKENIISKKKSLKMGDEKFYGYFLEKNTEQFFAISEYIDKLPFRIKDSFETDFKSDVFFFIRDVEEIEIPAEKKLEYRELVDILCRFNHSNKKHQLLYNIAAITGYMDRINARFSTDAGFGKDSIVSVIQMLVNSTVNLYGATFAKLEYVLMNKLIILNELGNLKKDDKMDMQEFLLAVGGMFNTYTKRTRKTNTTQEQYDISRLSLLLFYNLPSYYTGKAQEYFDQMFTKAVINRFIPFYFEGRLTTEFEKLINPKLIMNEHKEIYKNVIATLNYFRKNRPLEIRYETPKEITFGEDIKRYERTFRVILKYVALYAKDQEEFNDLSLELYNCYSKYKTLIEVKKDGLK